MTYEEAVDEILVMLKSSWDSTGYKMFYPNVQEDRDISDSPWAEVNIFHLTGRQSTLGGVGKRHFSRNGVIVVSVYTLPTNSLQTQYQLTKIVSDTYEGAHSAGGIWFRNVRINELGNNGTFNKIDVIIEFDYFEEK